MTRTTTHATSTAAISPRAISFNAALSQLRARCYGDGVDMSEAHAALVEALESYPNAVTLDYARHLLHKD